jgi:ATP-dependent RNA helicase DeaD
VKTEEAPHAAPAPAVDDVARAALERADRGDRGDRKKKRTEPTAETREFWETWAESKPATPAAAAEPAAEAAAEAPRDSEERPRGRDRDRGRGRDRDRGEKRGRRDDRQEATSEEPKPKHDTKREAPAADGNQARLFVSLGKKHGVSADDLRTLLAGPIGGDTARIGSVSLRDSHAHVRVPEDVVEAIISAVNGTTHNEHSVTVERSRA